MNPRCAMSSFPCSHKFGFNKPILAVILLLEVLPGNVDETTKNQPPDDIPSNIFTVVRLL